MWTRKPRSPRNWRRSCTARGCSRKASRITPRTTRASWSPEAANKTSLILSLGNTPGTLHRALGVFAARGLNLTKIESRPLPGRPWEYLFYLDVVDTGQGIGSALEELRALTSGIRILGTYPAR